MKPVFVLLGGLGALVCTVLVRQSLGLWASATWMLVLLLLYCWLRTKARG